MLITVNYVVMDMGLVVINMVNLVIAHINQINLVKINLLTAIAVKH